MAVKSKYLFFGRHALLVLMVIFFLLPFAFRGARLALQGMKNDVRDWLPADFPETAELDWFRQHFLGEQFIVVSWDGCHGDADDERFKLFLAKLSADTPPSQRRPPGDKPGEKPGEKPLTSEGVAAPDAGASSVAVPLATGAQVGVDDAPLPIQRLDREDNICDKLELFTTGNLYENWGGLNEKWLKGREEDQQHWYYLTPEGELYRWDGVDAPLAALWRRIGVHWLGHKLPGTFVHRFPAADASWYYRNPRRLRAQLFKSVTTGPMVLRSLTAPGGVLQEDPQEAQDRLAGSLFGPDSQQTCLVVTLTDAGRHDLHLALGRGMLGKPLGLLYEVADEVGLRAEQLHLGGPPVDNVAIDEEGTITLVRLVGFCTLLGLGLGLLCLRSISATFMVFFVGGMAAVMSIAFVYWFGSSVDAVMMSMPALVYVLGLSGAVHIMNYYYSAVNETGLAGAPERALRHAWKPAVFCNVTTAIGMFSLFTSELIPIRKFGIFSGLGVIATLLLLFFYLPAALQLWPQKPRQKPRHAADASWSERYLSGFWAGLGKFCIRYHWPVTVGWIAIIAVVGFGVTRIRTSVNMLKMFHAEAKIIKDYEWLEANLGRLVPMEIVLKVHERAQLPPAAAAGKAPLANPDEQYQLSFLERMELTTRTQRVIESEFGSRGRDLLGRTMSAATFAPVLPPQRGDTNTFVRRGTTNRRLEAHREQFLHSDYLRVDEQDGSELWRVSLRIAATKGIDYGEFVNELKSAVEPVARAYCEREHVLRELVVARGGERPLGAKVLLLGLPATAFVRPDKTAEEDPATPAAEQETVATASGTPSVDQTKIFARTLYDLLQSARLKVSAHIAEKSTLPEKWPEFLASRDCVILVTDEGYDLATVQKHARCIVDARSHRVDPHQVLPGSYQPDRDAGAPAVEAVYTGLVPIVYKAQRTLLDSLIQSTFWSFITITPLMMFIARSLTAGAIAMLPNVLPVFVVFGGMGWLGIDVDVGSMMTASIALGVAVDDTIHYLNWFREEYDRLGDRHQAILAAYRHCATPTFEAAVISGLGLSVFALSTFTPTERFGYLMLIILWAGVVAELVFFPAILAGPLGAAFRPRRRKPDVEVRAPHTPPCEPSALATVGSSACATRKWRAPWPPPNVILCQTGKARSADAGGLGWSLHRSSGALRRICQLVRRALAVAIVCHRFPPTENSLLISSPPPGPSSREIHRARCGVRLVPVRVGDRVPGSCPPGYG